MQLIHYWIFCVSECLYKQRRRKQGAVRAPQPASLICNRNHSLWRGLGSALSYSHVVMWHLKNAQPLSCCPCLRQNYRSRVYVWRLMASFADWKLSHSCLLLFFSRLFWFSFLLSNFSSKWTQSGSHSCHLVQFQSCLMDINVSLFLGGRCLLNRYIGPHGEIQAHKVWAIQLASRRPDQLGFTVWK